MAKAKTTANPDDLVKQALLKIAMADGPVRLSGKGEDAVFSSTAGANKEAIARLKNETQPLIVERGEGKAQTVALTPIGFERVVDAIPAEKVVSVVSGLAGNLSPSARVTFLQELVRKTPQVISGLVPLLEAAMTAEKTASETRAKEAEKQRANEAASLAALEQWKLLLQARKKQRIDALKQELVAEGTEPEEPTPQPPTKPTKPAPSLAPTDAEDVNFLRNVARRLVSSWVDAWDANKPDAREFLESAIWNVSGFRLVGEVGQRLTFDGRYHEGGPGLFTNDVVRIVRPGWLLEEADDREHVVLKAQVTKA
ncbi:MAG TPA: hypothetical protein VG122_09360 [Gemmata sp.]|jgi:hypothetical protein|nr:hypothetical protein [Gemmata sp.]